MTQHPSDLQFVLHANRGDRVIQLRMSRNTTIALITSILIHLILLLTFNPKLIPLGEKPNVSAPLSITLNTLPSKKSEAEPLPQPSQPEKAPEPVVKKPKVKPVFTPERSISKPLAPAIPHENPTQSMTQPAPTAPTTPSPSKEVAPATDMMALVNANRERRLANEGYTSKDLSDNSQQQRSMTEDEMRDARIKRNLMAGQNGVFQILGKNSRSATLSFRGWTNDTSNAKREIVAVEAGVDGDIDRAIVRKMIEIIRRYYSGDFNWESYRLGRIVVLSARREDNAGLEDFLLHEGIPGLSPR